jgi:predicted nucleic acid-binding protein
MKQNIYLETSVVGAYLDNGEPFRRDLTIRWWEHEMGDYRAVISPLVVAELNRLKDPHRTSYLKLLKGIEQVELSEEASILAEGYISRGIFHRKYIADALHVAIASFHKIDYLVTWNFGHLANVRRQARIKLFNTAAGFFVPMIVTPEFLVSEATETSLRPQISDGRLKG